MAQVTIYFLKSRCMLFKNKYTEAQLKNPKSLAGPCASVGRNVRMWVFCGYFPTLKSPTALREC